MKNKWTKNKLIQQFSSDIERIETRLHKESEFSRKALETLKAFEIGKIYEINNLTDEGSELGVSLVKVTDFTLSGMIILVLASSYFESESYEISYGSIMKVKKKEPQIPITDLALYVGLRYTSAEFEKLLKKACNRV
jgi:hypothetical protein